MKIYGIGTDIVSCARIDRLWSLHGMHFAKKILSLTEVNILEKLTGNQVAFLAKRFAGKEAVAKALNIGFRDNIFLTQISIENDVQGKPHIVFYGPTKKYVENLADLQVDISLSDEHDYAVAFVIVSTK